jgi:hypothetical protein
MVTATGVVLLIVGLLPNMSPLFPQQYAVPVVVRAQENLPLTVIVENMIPLGIVTATGMVLPFGVVPLPSWPLDPLPQQYAVPVVVRAQVCPDPAAAAIVANETPLGIVTATGALLSVVEPLLPAAPQQ